MKCMGCVSAVKSALENIPGIQSADVELDSAIATIEGDADPAIVMKTLRDAGYPASSEE